MSRHPTEQLADRIHLVRDAGCRHALPCRDPDNCPDVKNTVQEPRDAHWHAHQASRLLDRGNPSEYAIHKAKAHALVALALTAVTPAVKP